MIKHIISRCGNEELLFLLEVVLDALKNGERSTHDNLVHRFLLSRNELSTGGGVLFLSVVQFARIRRKVSLIERLETAKQVLTIKEALLAQVRSRHVTGGENQDSAMEHGVSPDSVSATVVDIYRNFLKRIPAGVEMESWANRIRNALPFRRFVDLVPTLSDAWKCADFPPACSHGRFIQFLCDAFQERFAFAREIDHWRRSLESGLLSREEILRQWFEQALRELDKERKQNVHNSRVFHIFGSSEKVTIDDWLKREKLLEELEPVPHTSEPKFPRFYIKTQPRILVTAIASLYRGGLYIQQFLDNISSQSIFDDYCELIIVDANSPENEYTVIEPYTSQYKNIIYKRMDYQIGIYEAWNIALEASRGEYLTSTNVDDLRRNDSLELQAAVLDSLPFVDVVYQDFYFTFNPSLSFERIAAIGYKSNLPIVTSYNMMEFNSPHSAPMWRKSLHGELGNFDAFFKAAGDYEFWMRCLLANKTFYKLNEPVAAYYQNPEGLSTRADTRALEEKQRVLKEYAHGLLSENFLVDRAEYLSRMGFPVPGPLCNGNRYEVAQAALRGMAADFKRGIKAMQG